MDYTIVDNRIQGPKVKFLNTPGKDSGTFGSGQPDVVVIHYTAGGSIESSVKTLQDPKVKASAHLVVGTLGEIRQLIPFDKIAWHAGKSSFLDRSGLNQYSIGIEIDNPGRLAKSGSKYDTWFGRSIPETEVFEGVHRNESEVSYWHRYTEAQIACVFSICSVLKETYGIEHIVGHEEISPGRKVDPGPAFPLEKLRQQLLEDRSREVLTLPVEMVAPKIESGQEAGKNGEVIASRLNIRHLPSTDANMVSDPLIEGTPVEIIGESNGWLNVKVTQTGWIKKEYVKVT